MIMIILTYHASMFPPTVFWFTLSTIVNIYFVLNACVFPVVRLINKSTGCVLLQPVETIPLHDTQWANPILIYLIDLYHDEKNLPCFSFTMLSLTGPFVTCLCGDHHLRWFYSSDRAMGYILFQLPLFYEMFVLPNIIFDVVTFIFHSIMAKGNQFIEFI